MFLTLNFACFVFVCVFVIRWFGFLVAAGLLYIATRRFSWITSRQCKSNVTSQHTWSEELPAVIPKTQLQTFLGRARCKKLWHPGRVSFYLVYTFLPRPGPCGSEHFNFRERPVATQHSLRNCVENLATFLPRTCNTTSWNWTVTKFI